MVDLREIPIGTVIEFFGEHQDSKYLMVLVQNESERQVKIWLKGRGNGAIGDIGNIVSIDYDNWTGIEKGVLQLDRNYSLPHFSYDRNDNVTIREPMRTEPYTQIFIKRPEK